MTSRGTTWRWLALIGCGAVAGLVAWLMVVQFILIVLTPFGTWQTPTIAKVRVLDTYRDAESQFTDFVSVDRDGEARNLIMLKGEAANLRADEEIWVLDNYYVTTTRPAQFRLTPIRLLLEYPEPLLILALLGIWRIRKTLAKAAVEDPNRKRTVLVDDFHARAQRFVKAKGNPGDT